MSKSSKARPNSPKAGTRRDELRRTVPKPTAKIRTLLHRPEVVHAMLTVVGFILVVGLLVIWSRDQEHVVLDQIMLDTRLKRLDYAVEDREETERRREEAEASSPRVYRLNGQYLEELQHALNGLPKAVEGKTTLEEISGELISEYRLTEPGLAALQVFADGGRTLEPWEGCVRRLITNGMRYYPLLISEEYQKYSKTLYRALLTEGGQIVPLGNETNVADLSEEVDERLETIVAAAGFPPEVRQFVQARLAWEPKPTFVFDAETTDELARTAAAAVEPVMIEHARGEIIYRRGDRLSSTQYDELKAERQAFAEQADLSAVWPARIGTLGLAAILSIFGAGFVLIWYPGILKKTVRLIALWLLMVSMLAVTVILSGQVPQLLFAAAIAPTLLMAIIVLLSYDQRLALFMSTVHCGLVTLALHQGVGWFVVLLAGCGTMIAQLREVRNRNTLIRAAIVTALVLAAGTLLHGLVVSPRVEGIWTQIIGQTAWSFVSAIVIGFLVLGILPSIERLFDITTGMTLAELRDPSQTLLRQLQQRAPGTYNHSLQVANIAEAAADAIGADSLLVYVGALYHDIGKINKPEYFVENQAGGFNKHSKLRPAMSLLVIIGHVKDGIELAREYGLPRMLQHFIETHHGTTLVEYFYHAAKSQAEAEAKTAVDEVEFRYPGPKPRSREAGILMIADAVESATRAMAEPNPSRIENLVRDISRKRLLDGQFDECDLTFRELDHIEDAIIARLCAIHHSRIAYPTTKAEEPAEAEAEPAVVKQA